VRAVITKLKSPETPAPVGHDAPLSPRAVRPRRHGDGLVQAHAELYRLLAERVVDYAIFALDPDGYILNWNSGAQRVKGYGAEEVIGQHFSIFYPTERQAENFPDRELEIARTTGRCEDEGWRVRKDGSVFWANVVITALRDDAGDLVGFAKITRDLT
jgi:PAS domain S-box-containing protein